MIASDVSFVCASGGEFDHSPACKARRILGLLFIKFQAGLRALHFVYRGVNCFIYINNNNVNARHFSVESPFLVIFFKCLKQ